MKFRKLIAFLLAAMMLAVGSLSTASAGSAEDEIYRQRVEEFEAMKERGVWIDLEQDCAWYSLSASKFYARKITGVAPDGSWILGPWELLSNAPALKSILFRVDGTCFAFAYSFDILWGTDWPYSGVFWSRPGEQVSGVRVKIGGTCRMASIQIAVDGKTVVSESNCSSHSEWRP